jgi:heat shock protein 4
VLFNHLCDEFKGKYKIDVRSNARASLRLRLACEKAKKVLSSNPETPLSIECLMNDVDVKAHLTRELFEQLADPLLVRVLQPAQQAMATAGLSVEDIAGVEIVGGCSRLPALCKALEGFFGKTLRRTMNAAESVARGCALQGAMLSPTFHVTRRFEVEDVATYPIEFTWAQSEDDPAAGRTGSEVFPKGNTLPSAKMLTFFRSGIFPLEAHVKEPGMLSHPGDAQLATFEIGPLPAAAGAKAKLKVKAKLNLHGCVSLDSAHIVEEVDGDGDAAQAGGADTKMDDAEQTAGGAGADGEAAGAAGADGEAPKKRLVKFDVPVKQHLAGVPTQRLRELHEKELEMALQDRVMEETKERKNALEAYVLAMRSRLNDALGPYCDEAAKAAFNKTLQEAEDWLYDEGEDETKSVYVKKLEALKALGDPIEERAKEDSAREPAASALRAAAEQYLAACDQGQYAHIAGDQLESVKKEASAALAWLQDKQAQQGALPKTASPAFKAADCTKKAEALDRLAKPILATPKPAPAAPPVAEADQPMAEAGNVPPVEDLD